MQALRFFSVAAVFLFSGFACGVASVDAAPVTVSVDDTEGSPGGEADVVVRVKDGQGLGGLQFHLTYDPAALEWKGASLHDEAGGGMIDDKLIEPGRVRIALVAQKGVDGERPLVVGQFAIAPAAGSTVAIDLSGARAWTRDEIKELQVKTVPGEIHIVARQVIPLTWIVIAVAVILVLLLLTMAGRRKTSTPPPPKDESAY